MADTLAIILGGVAFALLICAGVLLSSPVGLLNGKFQRASPEVKHALSCGEAAAYSLPANRSMLTTARS